MAGLSLAMRDLPTTRRRLEAWFADRHRHPAEVSELVSNTSSGYSSESLRFTARSVETPELDE